MSKDPMKNQAPKNQGLRGWAVQWTFPVDNPVNNVRRRTVKGMLTFECPVNLPDVHNLTLTELLGLSQIRESLDLSTGLNNTVALPEKE